MVIVMENDQHVKSKIFRKKFIMNHGKQNGEIMISLDQNEIIKMGWFW